MPLLQSDMTATNIRKHETPLGDYYTCHSAIGSSYSLHEPTKQMTILYSERNMPDELATRVKSDKDTERGLHYVNSIKCYARELAKMTTPDGFSEPIKKALEELIDDDNFYTLFYQTDYDN